MTRDLSLAMKLRAKLGFAIVMTFCGCCYMWLAIVQSICELLKSSITHRVTDQPSCRPQEPSFRTRLDRAALGARRSPVPFHRHRGSDRPKLHLLAPLSFPHRHAVEREARGGLSLDRGGRSGDYLRHRILGPLALCRYWFLARNVDHLDPWYPIVRSSRTLALCQSLITSFAASSFKLQRPQLRVRSLLRLILE